MYLKLSIICKLCYKNIHLFNNLNIDIYVKIETEYFFIVKLQTKKIHVSIVFEAV